MLIPLLLVMAAVVVVIILADVLNFLFRRTHERGNS